MSKQGRILIVDDQKNWREELAATLRRNGFSAEAVGNTADALKHLSTAIYHIVILDIHFENDDPTNTEGITLLRELSRLGLNEATRVIMLTGYGTLEQAREAFKDYDVADFVSKTDAGTTLLKSVQQLFDQKLNINLELGIRWQTKKEIEQIAGNLKINRKRFATNATLRRQIMEELEDLLCRLFYEAEMVLVRPLTQGWSGSGVLLVQPFFKDKDRGRGEDVIFKFGDMKKIKEEHHKFQHYVKDLLGGARRTTVNGVRYTPHLGGIVYSLLGAGKDQLVDFAQFYQNTDDIARITDVLDHLFEDTCANWYINRSRIQPLALVTEYQRFFNYSRKKLERILTQRLLSVHVREKLEFTSLNSNRKFTNPLLARTDPSFTCYTSTCIMHGDLNQHNLFVDRAGFTWLIDFQATEPGHILRDLAMLDSVIRFQLLTAQEATLEERLRMEEVLCSASHFGQLQQMTSEFAVGNRALEKAFAAVIHLRTLAAKKVMQGRNDDLNEYYIALFYNALNTLKFPTLETVQLEHALLCASLLADRPGLC